MKVEKNNCYDEAIRELIDKENKIRDQRTNWFLVIQGFLIAAVYHALTSNCKINNNGDNAVIIFESFHEDADILFCVIGGLGILSSLSFKYAAWRSEMAIKMILACWDNFRIIQGERIENYSPVTTITDAIIGCDDKNANQSSDETDIESWNKKINRLMSPNCLDRLLNRLDFLMPYKFLPFIFAGFWCTFMILMCDDCMHKIICGLILVVLVLLQFWGKSCCEHLFKRTQAMPMFIYHIMIDRFAGCTKDVHRSPEPGFMGGNLRCIIEKLDYIQGLGMNAIMLSPFLESEAYHGYHIKTNCNKIDSHFGDEKDIKDLVAAIKKRGMKIIADFVPNHCHINNPLFSDKKHNDWFYYSDENNYKQYHGIKELPVFNLDTPDAREYMINQALWLCDLGFDYLRIDHATGPSYSFLKALRTEIKKKYPHVKLIGEVWGVEDFKPRCRLRYYLNTKRYNQQEAMQLEYIGVLDGVFDFEYYDIICEVIKEGDNVMYNHKLKHLIKKHFKRYPNDFQLWLFLDNHDLDRIFCKCNDNKDLVKELIYFTKSWNRPFSVFYGTEKGMENKRPLDKNIPYDDNNVRGCMEWDKINIIDKF